MLSRRSPMCTLQTRILGAAYVNPDRDNPDKAVL